MFGPPITAATLAAGPAGAGLTDPSDRNKAQASAAVCVRLTLTEESRLIRWARSGTVPQRIALRARIALLLAAGHSPRAVARTLGVGINTVARWRERVCRGGIDALTRDAPGRGRKRNPHPAWEPVLRDLMARTPPHGTRWTVRALAGSLGWTVTTTARRIKGLGGRR